VQGGGERTVLAAPPRSEKPCLARHSAHPSLAQAIVDPDRGRCRAGLNEAPFRPIVKAFDSPGAAALFVRPPGPGRQQDLSLKDLPRPAPRPYPRALAEAKVIVGLRNEGHRRGRGQLFISLFSRGHALLIGVPGLAKTLMISSLAKVLNLSFNRIQFTPDLMPSDITGTEVIQEDRTTGEREFKFIPGPIFANVILADEINRTPPKTQAALLEAMQEHQVTAGGKRHDLDEPFFVLATQNPIEQEGTYPLPEAQLDRFMFMIKVDYPTIDEEREIMRRTTEGQEAELKPVLEKEDILQLQKIVRRVPIADHVLDYALRLTRTTRLTDPSRPAGSRSGCLGCGSAREPVPRPRRRRPTRSCCTAACTSRRRTSARSRTRCCATASSRASAPRPRASARGRQPAEGDQPGLNRRVPRPTRRRHRSDGSDRTRTRWRRTRPKTPPSTSTPRCSARSRASRCAPASSSRAS
jgi:MoxR-like ATPase